MMGGGGGIFLNFLRGPEKCIGWSKWPERNKMTLDGVTCGL